MAQVHAGLDLSRRRLDVCLLSEHGELIGELAVPRDADGLAGLVARTRALGPVRGVIESMTGARFVHDTLEQHGWDVRIADAHRVKGLAPLACKTDKIDSRVLALLSHRELIPEIWLPDPRVRAEREQARFRLHLVKHKSMLKHRIHATMMTFGHPCPVTDLFGAAGRELLDRLQVPQPWRGTIDASLYMIDYLETEIAGIERQLREGEADHPYVPLARDRSSRDPVAPGGSCWKAHHHRGGPPGPHRHLEHGADSPEFRRRPDWPLMPAHRRMRAGVGG
jgi:transposase